MAKETYAYGKRDLFIWQKRPMHMAKDTYQHRHTRAMHSVMIKSPSMFTTCLV